MYGLQYTRNDLSATEFAKASSAYETLLSDMAMARPAALPREAFDLVFSRMVNEHVCDGERYYRNIFHVLRPGGVTARCFSTLYTMPFVINRLRPEWLASECSTWPPARPLPSAQIRRALQLESKAEQAHDQTALRAGLRDHRVPRVLRTPVLQPSSSPTDACGGGGQGCVVGTPPDLGPDELRSCDRTKAAQRSIMLKVLMLTPYLPFPPVSGGRSRTYNLIREFRGRSHITLICFGRPEERAFDTTPLADLCQLLVVDRPSSPSLARAALLSATSIKPVVMRLYRSRAYREAVRLTLTSGDYDVIHVESFYMLQNVPEDVRVPVLLCEPAIEYVAWARQARVTDGLVRRSGMALEARKLRVFEPRAWKRADLVGAMSTLDAASIEHAAPRATVTLVPNGVDLDFFQVGQGEREAANAVYMGDYSYFPNVDAALYFLNEIMPLIRVKRPDFTLTLLGKDAPGELIALGHDRSTGVRIKGLVDDTRPYLTSASMFVCPLRSASGTRFKLLESMACGCPVVSSSIGSEGLEAVNGVHLLLADSAPAFANAVLRLLEDRDEAARLGRSGRDWVQQNHAWSQSAQRLAEAYARLAPDAI